MSISSVDEGDDDDDDDGDTEQQENKSPADWAVFSAVNAPNDKLLRLWTLCSKYDDEFWVLTIIMIIIITIIVIVIMESHMGE